MSPFLSLALVLRYSNHWGRLTQSQAKASFKWSILLGVTSLYFSAPQSPENIGKILVRSDFSDLTAA